MQLQVLECRTDCLIRRSADRQHDSCMLLCCSHSYMTWRRCTGAHSQGGAVTAFSVGSWPSWHGADSALRCAASATVHSTSDRLPTADCRLHVPYTALYSLRKDKLHQARLSVILICWYLQHDCSDSRQLDPGQRPVSARWTQQLQDC